MANLFVIIRLDNQIKFYYFTCNIVVGLLY